MSALFVLLVLPPLAAGSTAQWERKTGLPLARGEVTAARVGRRNLRRRRLHGRRRELAAGRRLLAGTGHLAAGARPAGLGRPRNERRLPREAVRSRRVRGRPLSPEDALLLLERVVETPARDACRACRGRRGGRARKALRRRRSDRGRFRRARSRTDGSRLRHRATEMVLDSGADSARASRRREPRRPRLRRRRQARRGGHEPAPARGLRARSAEVATPRRRFRGGAAGPRRREPVAGSSRPEAKRPRSRSGRSTASTSGGGTGHACRTCRPRATGWESSRSAARCT